MVTVTLCDVLFLGGCSRVSRTLFRFVPIPSSTGRLVRCITVVSARVWTIHTAATGWYFSESRIVRSLVPAAS